ncbi:DNA glycosylase [Penicillium cinerascens]|uniref:DNA glycosylase n=1 Tax=Penicillium cinerascens TaxID=70096 RepID=A0A9W9SZW7_9EURO|nr:DNA glycosylase [Penicillium cinerascens]KAJ5203855.1 DNA glycosylase [Penicillium cinerascens]
MKTLNSPMAPAGAVTSHADYEPRRSTRMKFKNPDYKGATSSSVPVLSSVKPSSTRPKLTSTDNVEAIVNPVASAEAERSKPSSGQEPATSSLKRKRPVSKTSALKANAKATAKSTKTKNTTKRKRTTKAANAAVKNPSKTAATRSPRIKPEQSSLLFQASDKLPHNLGSLPGSLATDKVPARSPNGSDKENRGLDASAEHLEGAGNEADTQIKPIKKKSKSRVSYGLTVGKTPYPEFLRPTAAECEEVNRLLSEIHGEVTVPKTIPEPSLTVTGCGEVPSVLDALIRTLLSGATSGANSALAFNGLVKRFGILSEGIGKGSVNWDAVRQAPLNDVFEAIKRGGLAAVKSKNLKAILDQVYEENQEQVKRLEAEDPSADDMNPKMSPENMENEKAYRLACTDQHFLSLDHIHKLSTPEAMAALVKYPGIGPKTAACVCLFCLQRPCFAVDTHIFRITKWLGWVPDNASEITAFSHLEVRIPDHLKYPLHQLFIKHGKTCPRCRAITGETSVGWEQGCAIDHLVRRTGARKGGPPPKKKSKVTGRVKRKVSAATPSAANTNDPKAAVAVTPTASRRNPSRKASSQVQVVIESTPSDLDESSTPAPPTTAESAIVETAAVTLSPTTIGQVANSSSLSTPTPEDKTSRASNIKKKPTPQRRKAKRRTARKSTAKGKGRKAGS